MEIHERRTGRYSKMFEPASIGTLKVKNRLIMAPMGTRLASESGAVTQRQIQYYAERAKGGVGTIITEVTCVDHPMGVTGPTNMTLHDNGYIGSHNELVEEIHAWGANIICQLVHAGRQTKPASLKGMQPVAPSPIPCKFLNVMPRELKTDEVEGIVQKFVEAAVRARTAGYDGIELHGAHGYLIAQFMSASSNHRKDRYGGDFQGRMTFPLEIIQGIRKEVGRDFPVLFRFSADEFVDGGRVLDESRKVAKLLESAGIDALHVSAGTYDSMATMIEPMSYPEAWKIYLAEAIKAEVHIPVIGVGVIRTPEVAEEILEKGGVDFLALGRTLLADPYWPQKAREGRDEDINRCICCNIGCIGGRIFKDLHIRCTVNPMTGREGIKGQLAPIGREQRVCVVGGGPAGMMAALAASDRGHRVVLFEKSDRLGGQLLLAEEPPGKEKISWLLEYLRNQVQKRDIDLRLGQAVNGESILSERPNAVIVAAGARPLIPKIPGTDQPFVCTSWDILDRKKVFKGKRILVAGGGTVGSETALYLAPVNKRVVIVEMLEGLALDMEPINRMELLSRIEKSGIEVLLGRQMDRIETDAVYLLNQETMASERLEVDAVVLSLGAAPENELRNDLGDDVEKVFFVGDCCQPRKIIDAIYEGFRAGIRI
ncbi:MAG: FAD-dependent oxidoreductase [Deltaproteobacteria bacterium]|nr:FAD-dependent oxidoreductase [Deltaproteobacteria bacterium]